MTLIQILIIVFACFAITRTVIQFKKGALTMCGLFFWILFWIASCFVAALPKTTDMIARFMGVGRGADAVVYVSLAVLFYFVFHLYAKIENVEREITKLVRKLAIKDEDRK